MNIISPRILSNLFSCSCWPSVSSLEKCLFRSSAHFSLGLLDFFFSELYEFLYILSIDLLLDYIFADILFHSVYCLVCSMDGFLFCEEAS